MSVNTRILLSIIVLLNACFMVNCEICKTSVRKSFEDNEIVPDVVAKAPTRLIKVHYPDGLQVCGGNILTPTQTKDVPIISYDTRPGQFYTVAITDPDAPSRAEPTYREWHHWLVGNVRGNSIDSGDLLSEYVGAGPGYGSGLHRYVFLVYRQPGLINFEETRLNNTSAENRAPFSIRKFATKYNLGNPVAGNFFQAEYDDYVPILYEQLGL